MQNLEITIRIPRIVQLRALLSPDAIKVSELTNGKNNNKSTREQKIDF